MEGHVVIEYDYSKHKMRAVNESEGGYVRFPNKLRTAAGVRYWVEDLAPGKSGSWIARGRIIRVSS